MRIWGAISAVAVVLTTGAAAQDTEVKSRTRVQADDATSVSLTGCLTRDTATGRFTLTGVTAAAGDDVTTRTRVETDVDDDDVDVEVKTRSTADDPVGTSGRRSSYVLIPRGNVALAPHVGTRVQVSAVVLEPGEDDAEVEIKDRTTIDPDDAPSRTERSRTRVEVENVAHGEYAVVSVKTLAPSCEK